jgi:hypothetical protein
MAVPEIWPVLLAFLYSRVAGRPGIQVLPPERQITTGIYHPQVPAPFASFAEYARWYESKHLAPPSAPCAGTLRLLERTGCNVEQGPPANSKPWFKPATSRSSPWTNTASGHAPSRPRFWPRLIAPGVHPKIAPS